ncbi:MAG: ABC transporter ATP-binding protein [Ignisphaera sp.]
MRILLKNVTKRYSRNIIGVRNVSIDIEGEAIVSILGPNGSGKSTILKLIAGLAKPSEGEVYVDSYRMPYERDKVATYMSAVIENPVPHSNKLSVRELLDFACKVKGLGMEDLREVVSLLNIEANLGKRLDELSKGLYKKVILACALMGRPRIILLDEPFEGLDMPTTFRLSEYLKELSKKSMIILATHSLHIASSLSDRVVLLRDGSIYREYGKEQLAEIIKRRRIVIETRSEIDVNKYVGTGVIEVKKIGDRIYEVLYDTRRELDVLKILASIDIVSIKEREEDLVQLYSDLYG